jgi:hypothetical protein
MNITSFKDYRKLLRSALLSRRANDRQRYSFREMSRACRVQPAYLSNVLLEKGHFSSDQIFLACKFLGFAADEEAFVMALAEHAKSICKERREVLAKQTILLKESLGKTERHIKVRPVESQENVSEAFHLDIQAQIVNMFLAIDTYRRSPERLPRLLNMSASQFNEQLRKLESWGLIRQREGNIETLQNEMHLPRKSSVFPAFHTLRLLKCIEVINRNLRDDDYNFSVLFTSSPEVKAQLRSRFLDFLNEAQKTVGNGAAEEVCLMTFDLIGIP